MTTLPAKPKKQTSASADELLQRRLKLPLWKRLLFSTVTMCLTFVVLILVGEVVLRLVGWPTPGYYLNGRGPIELSAPGLPNGRYPPNQVGETRTYEYTHPWKTNRYGFRDRALVPKQPGEHRIGLLGDSMVAGFGVQQHQRFMELWFEAIDPKPDKATVWNLGSSGSGTCQLASGIEELAEIYELDEVILALFSGNELSDNEVWQKDQTLQLQSEQGEVESVRSTGPAWRRWLRQNSRVSTYLWVHGIRYVADKVAPTECFTGQFTQMWPVTEEGLNRLKRAIGDRPLTIWYLPDQSEWDNERWKAIKDLGDADRFIMRDAVIQWAQQNETAVVDITPVFLGRTQPEVKYRIDGHWNASGHRIVAEAVANDSNASFLQRQVISVEAEPKGGNAGE